MTLQQTVALVYAVAGLCFVIFPARLLLNAEALRTYVGTASKWVALLRAAVGVEAAVRITRVILPFMVALGAWLLVTAWRL